MKFLISNFKFLNKQGGQSLVEVVVAIAVAVIIVLALVGITTVSIRNATRAKNQALATQYAQETIENIRALRDQSSWDDFTSNCGKNLPSLPSPFGLSVHCYLPGLALDCSFTADNCEVEVEVYWTDAQGTHKSELITRLSKWK